MIKEKNSSLLLPIAEDENDSPDTVSRSENTKEKN